MSTYRISTSKKIKQHIQDEKKMKLMGHGFECLDVFKPFELVCVKPKDNW